MLDVMEIQASRWVIFILGILFLLALDLGVFHRKERVETFKGALAWTAVWFALAMGFAGFIDGWLGREEATEFVAGYIIELSLSMDNVFVIALIFTYFRVPDQYQHRVLFWGIMGALVMRGVMIGFGALLVEQFAWVLYLFGAFLLITGIKMSFSEEDGVHPEKNPVIKLAKKIFPVTAVLDGQKFFTRENGKRALTPLAIVLIMVETTDLIFALDSIPAIFAITTKPFIVFTSNVFAILGLRSLYFVLAHAIRYFHYLKYGLSIVLVFVGMKMLINPHDPDNKQWFQKEIPTDISLLIVVVIIATAILTSIIFARREAKEKPPAT